MNIISTPKRKMKLWIRSILNFCIKNLSRLKSKVDTDWVNKDAEEYQLKSNFKIESLTPTEDAKEFDVYCNALEDALYDSKNYNIALTGGYGTGKSSVIETFLQNSVKYDQNNVLRVSLANFNEVEDQGNGTNRKRKFVFGKALSEVDEKIGLEISILQQFIIQLTNKSLKQKFRKNFDNPFGRWHILLLSIFLVFTVLSHIAFWDTKFMLFFLTSEDFEELNMPLAFRIWTFVLMILTSFALIWFVLTKVNESKVKSLNLNKFAVEFEVKNNMSVLNSYIEELIYLFKKSEYELVILEDLDRFNDIEVFDKLREVSILLKNSSDLKEKKIKFLFVVRESIFANESDKNKFFDVLIPVVPFINSKNSKDKLLELFKPEIENNENNQNQFKELLKSAALCIHDMRAIKNIYNDYNIYKEVQSNNFKINYISLLAMVIYKNILPNDFEKINLGSSILDSVFNEKVSLINQISPLIDKQIKELEEQNISDLDDHEKHGINLSNDTNFDWNTIKMRELEFEKRTLAAKSVVELIRICRRYDSKKDFTTLLNLKNEKLIDHNKMLLIRSLVFEGFIKSDYYQYTSIFHEGSMSTRDRSNYWDIKSESVINFDEIFDHPKSVLDEFTESMWHNLNWLNEALFDELVFSDTFESRLRVVLKNESPYLFTFLNYYIPRSTDLMKFTTIVCHLSQDLIVRAIKSNELDNDVFDLLLRFFVQQDSFTIRVQNHENIITQYLQNKEVVSGLFDEKYKSKLSEFLKILNVKFKILEDEKNWATQLIFENNYYEINIAMIQLWLKLFAKDENSVPSYTAIQNSELDNLKEYVNSNISIFVEDVLLQLKEQNLDWQENEESLKQLLAFDNELLHEILKSEIIKNVNFNEFNLTNYSQDFWTEIVSNKKMLCSWGNIIDYYEEHNINDEFLALINNESWIKNIDEYKINDNRKLTLDQAADFWADLLQYEIIPKSLHALKNEFKFYFRTNVIQGTTDKSNLELLISRRLLNPKFAIDCFEQIVEYFKDELLHMNFCLSYEPELLKQLENPAFFKGSINQKELVFVAENNFSEKFFLFAISKINDMNSLKLSDTEAESIMTKIIKFNYHSSMDFLAKVLGFISEKNQPKFFTWIYDKIKFDKFSSHQLLVSFKGNLNNLDKPLYKFALKETDVNLKFVELLKSLELVKNYSSEKGQIVFKRNSHRNFNS